MRDLISKFLACERFAVVGASADRAKFGNRVFRHYLEHGKSVIPVNPKEAEIEGVPCVKTLRDIGAPAPAVSIITPPPVTLKVVEEAAACGIRQVWMQPGAESPEAVARAEALGLSVIHSGPCILTLPDLEP